MSVDCSESENYDDVAYEYLCLLPNGKTYTFNETSQSFVSTKADGEQKVADYNETKYINYCNSSEVHQRLTYAEISATLKFEYIGHVQYESARDLHQMVFSIFDEMKEEGQFWDESICKKIRLGVVCEDLVVKHIGEVNGVDVGLGLFASKQIPIGTFLGEYTGIISHSVLGAGKTNYCCHYPSCDGGTYINAAQCGNIIRFINHSHFPNCQFQPIYVDGTCHIICVSCPQNILFNLRYKKY